MWLIHPRKWLEPHLVEALDALRSELAAYKGRLVSNKRLPTRGNEYLQLGSGDSRIHGFLNTDFFLNRQAEIHLDARFPLPFENSTWQGIYAHHVIEHLSYQDAFGLARECHRVLKPGGILRMVVPDLEVFLRIYADGDPGARRRIFELYPQHAMETLSVKTPLEMVDYVFRDNRFNRHLSSWDWETALTRLQEAGFSVVHRSKANVSLDTALAGHDKLDWSEFSLYVEAVK